MQTPTVPCPALAVAAVPLHRRSRIYVVDATETPTVAPHAA